MPAMKYDVKTVNGLPVVSAPEEVDVSNADELRQLLLACADEGHPILVVDMSETVFCDSTGLHQLVRAHKRATAAGGEARLVIAAPTVLRLFAIVGIDRFFPIFKSLDEAVASPSVPVAGPSARVAGPSVPVGGPSVPVGGPSVPVGGPSVPVGGPSAPVGGPSVPVAGPARCPGTASGAVRPSGQVADPAP